MTQKHFEAIAATFKRRIIALQGLHDNYQLSEAALMQCRLQLNIVAALQAEYFKTINPNFKRARFMTACGFGD